MYSLRSVGVMSCAKIMGMIYGCLGLIVVPFFLMGGFSNLLLGSQSSQPLAGIAMWFLALLVPVVYGLMGFVMGAFSAWVYNLIARWIGGIKLELEPIVSNSQSNLGTI
ncbi:MAG: hypothetical protein ACLPVW_00040 [Terriglobales bacterium]